MRIAFIYLFSVFILFSCRNYSGSQYQDGDTAQISADKLQDMNKQFVINESEDILNFARRHNLEMKTSGTGLRYAIRNNGTGKKPQDHTEVEIKYKRYFLTGDLIDSTETPVRYRISEGNDIRGVEEALTMMTEGASADLIIPAHLAYGLTGEGKIPPASAIYYQLELIKVK